MTGSGPVRSAPLAALRIGPVFSVLTPSSPRPSFHFHQIKPEIFRIMTETAPTDSKTFELASDSSWLEAVELFQREAASWLTAADAPQLMALRAIAKQLDAGTFQAALISQFTLIHRTLREKGDPERSAKGKATPQDDESAILDMFKSNPGAVWRADQ